MSVVTGHVVVIVLCGWSLMTSSSLDTDENFRSGRLRTVLDYSVEEEVPAGTLIGSGVAVDSGLVDRHGPEAVGSMRFRFLTPPPPYLAIDDVGGLIRTVSRVDREQICSDIDRRTCSIRLDVVVQPVNYFRIFKVCLTLNPLTPTVAIWVQLYIASCARPR